MEKCSSKKYDHLQIKNEYSKSEIKCEMLLDYMGYNGITENIGDYHAIGNMHSRSTKPNPCNETSSGSKKLNLVV